MTRKAILHCNPSVLSHVLDNGHNYEVSHPEILVYVGEVYDDDIPDDVEFCNYHNIDYNQVIRIEPLEE